MSIRHYEIFTINVNFFALEDGQVEEVDKSLFLKQWYLYFPLFVLIAPLSEEFFFRGIILGTWLKNNRTKLSYVGFSLLNVILFVFVHPDKSISLKTLLMSSNVFYFCWVAIRYGVWQSTIVHAAHNLAYLFFPIA